MKKFFMGLLIICCNSLPVYAGDCTVEECARAAVTAARDVEKKLHKILPKSSCRNGEVLTWEGNKFACKKHSTSCRVCTKITSNTTADGTWKCSNFSSENRSEASEFSGWASGSKYSVAVKIQCK